MTDGMIFCGYKKRSNEPKTVGGLSAIKLFMQHEKKDMNLFGFFTKKNNEKKTGWVETTAYFTGDVRKALPKGRVGFYYNDRPAKYNEYKIRYYAGDSERNAWYCFYPEPDPEFEEITDRRINIRYKKNRPWDYEVVSDISSDDQ